MPQNLGPDGEGFLVFADRTNLEPNPRYPGRPWTNTWAMRYGNPVADRYEPERLRELLPGVEFQQAISVVEAIAAKTEDRMMYDQRLKAQRDYQWGLDSARQEGWEGGELAGKIQILQQLLGEESSSTESLRARAINELSAILADLQQRLRSRES